MTETKEDGTNSISFFEGQIAIEDHVVDTPPTEEKGEQKSRPRAFLDFAKDWGGVATLVIALLYTFPSDLINKVINWREQNVVSARSALTQLEELTAAKILALESVKSDVWKSDYLSKTFDIRIFNIMVNNSKNFNAAIEQLTTSELVAIGSNYALGASQVEAIPFYEAAIKRSRTRDLRVFAAASREYGLVLFAPSSIQDIGKARDRYLDAIMIYGSKVNYLGPALYAIDLAELAGWELQVGDWKCGMDETRIAMDTFDKMSIVDQQVIATKNYFLGILSSKHISPNQPINGCPYIVPATDWFTPSGR